MVYDFEVIEHISQTFAWRAGNEAVSGLKLKGSEKNMKQV